LIAPTNAARFMLAPALTQAPGAVSKAPMSPIPSLDGPMLAPAGGGAPTSMVILIHGYGSNGEDLIALGDYWREALPHTLFLAPNAPRPCGLAPWGFEWWPLTDLEPAALAQGVRQSAPALDAYIDDQLARHGLSEDRLALVGFSQGTMMALHVGPRRARTLAGVVGYSGALVDPLELAREMRTAPPVLLVHGDADPTVPVTAMHQARLALEPLGFAVETHLAFDLGHSIDEAGLALGRRFLAERLG
jgi:phospholipase/carboxylesterase